MEPASTWGRDLSAARPPGGCFTGRIFMHGGHLPVLWTNLLIEQNASATFVMLLLIYMLIYQLDELVLFFVAVFSKHTKWKTLSPVDEIDRRHAHAGISIGRAPQPRPDE